MPPPETPRASVPSPSNAPGEPTAQAPRRGFLTKAMAVLIGGIVALFPLVTGLAFFADPLRKRKKAGRGGGDEEGFIKVATVDGLLPGVPQTFTVIDDRSDAWNLFPREPVGAVYLMRKADNKVEAFNVVCPHAGCFVEYQPGNKIFQCPCHNSSFKLDGSIANPASPAPRGLDALEVRIKNENEVWVKFQKFRSGTPQKVLEA